MIKVNKMFWIESILEEIEVLRNHVKEGRINKQSYSYFVRDLPIYCSKELTIRCFMRKTKQQLNDIYNDLKIFEYKRLG